MIAITASDSWLTPERADDIFHYITCAFIHTRIIYMFMHNCGKYKYKF